MAKKIDSLKLKVVGTLKVTMIVFAFVVAMFSLELSYAHTRDSSRADLIYVSHYRFFRDFVGRNLIALNDFNLTTQIQLQLRRGQPGGWLPFLLRQER